ncbi:MAG: sigma-70 family RNA polymerase sigma factor [Anaerolineae bacterium]|nr:sigma-70 family RNA polymerase sigma factor [Anaerolineae bacterium]
MGLRAYYGSVTNCWPNASEQEEAVEPRYADERDLVTALKAGDRAACAAMVERFSPRIYRLALKLVRDPDEAEDVLQETFISACEHVSQFEGRSSLGTWLYRIATNAGLMHLRRRQPDTVSMNDPVELEEGEFVPRQLVDWGWNPEDHALNEELKRVMDEAIAMLPETLRAAFVLRDIEGLSTAEAAEVLGITESAAKVRLHRARMRLREHLSRYFAAHQVAGANGGQRDGTD